MDCQNCGKEIISKWRTKRTKYCNHKCSYEHKIKTNSAGGKLYFSDETRKKMSKAHKGQPAWNKGQKLSMYGRKKLSDAHLGQKAWNKGISKYSSAQEKRNVPRTKWSNYKSQAKRAGREFVLTYEEFMRFWGQKCDYCGEIVKTIGLDRLDSSKGYSLTNVVSCCIICNIMKKDLMPDDFVNHCKKIVDNKLG